MKRTLTLDSVITKSSFIRTIVRFVLDAGPVVATLIKSHVLLDNTRKIASSSHIDHERKVSPILSLQIFCCCTDMRTSEIARKCYSDRCLAKTGGSFKKYMSVARLDSRINHIKDILLLFSDRGKRKVRQYRIYHL